MQRLTRGLRGLWDYTYGSLNYIFEQVSALPRAVNAAITHKASQQVVGHIVRIAIEDVVPLMLVQYSAQALQNKVNEQSEHDEQTIKQTTLMSAMFVINSCVAIYSFRKKTQILVRSALVTLEAPRAFSASRLSPSMDICQQASCSSMRFVQGTFRDLSAYYATEGAISVLNYLPYIGAPIAGVLSVYHNGRYIVTMALPEVCNRHQVEYMHEHAELALGLGIGHAASLWGITYTIEQLSGIPASYYRGSISPLLLATHTLLTNQIHLPKATIHTNRRTPDPLCAYQMLVGFTFDTLMIGLKQQVPRLLRQSEQVLPWQNISTRLNLLYNTGAVKTLFQLYLPSMLRSQKAFSQDPIVAANWEIFKDTSIETIDALEAMQKHLVLKVAAFSPQRAAMVSNTLFGTPELIVEILVKILSTPAFMDTLTAFRQNLARQPALLSENLIQASTMTPLRYEDKHHDKAISHESEHTARPSPDTLIIPRIRKQTAQNISSHALTSPQKTDLPPPTSSAADIIKRGMFKKKSQAQENNEDPIVEHDGWEMTHS